MNIRENIKIEKPSFWDSAWKGIALVSGVFSLVLVILLFANVIMQQAGLPEKEQVYSQELEQKKAQLTQDPTNEELKNEIRQLDLELRQSFFARLSFSTTGKYLLLIGIVVFLISINKVLARHPKQFRPKKKGEADPNQERNQLQQYRQAVTGLGVLLLLGIVVMAFMPKIPLQISGEEVAEGPAYPTKEEFQENWPQFRGPGGLGISTHENIPTSWDGETGEGIVWKKEVQLPGNNSPIAWEDRVFISGANENENAVFCYSVPTGELLWKGDATNVPGSTGKEVQVFQDTGYAASTMATDGERVFAIFADGNLICFDYDGNRVWGKNMGVPDSIYTFATSLAIYQDLLLLQFDQGVEDDDLSSMLAMDVETGQVVWQQPRPVANSWTSPVIVDTIDGVQLLTSSEPWNISYRPDTGEELWRAKLMGTDLAPSPVYANGLAFFTQPNEAVFAIKVDGRGDVTESHLAWRVDTPAPEISSPICTNKHIFLLASMGLISCHDTETGELVWEHEIEDYFQSSPVLVGEWMYMLAESGKTYRVKASDEVEIAEEVPFIDEWLKASPAFLDGKIFIRGDKNLYCIGNP